MGIGLGPVGVSPTFSPPGHPSLPSHPKRSARPLTIVVAGLNGRRLSAIAAPKHWRRAKTALRVVAAERPLVRRSVTHRRTPLLVIARSGASPKRGRTCFCMVVSSRAQVVARRSCRVSNHSSTTHAEASPRAGDHARSLRPTRLQSRPCGARRRRVASWFRSAAFRSHRDSALCIG